MTRSTSILLVLIALVAHLGSGPARAADAKPKYGPMATRLSDAHDYIKQHAAPDFWALIPYYAAQEYEGGCSLASVAMVVNAARVHQRLTADDPLVTQKELVDKVKGPVGNLTWKAAVGGEAVPGTGVSLDQLGTLVAQSLKAYGQEPEKLETVHAETSDAFRKKLHQTLVENEKSDRDFVVLNFNQQKYTGDADVGHIAPLAAYDAAAKRALVFDPDRHWYEPYWVSEQTLLDGMATQDKTSGKTRGYIYVRLKKAE